MSCHISTATRPQTGSELEKWASCGYDNLCLSQLNFNFSIMVGIVNKLPRFLLIISSAKPLSCVTRAPPPRQMFDPNDILSQQSISWMGRKLDNYTREGGGLGAIIGHSKAQQSLRTVFRSPKILSLHLGLLLGRNNFCYNVSDFSIADSLSFCIVSCRKWELISFRKKRRTCSFIASANNNKSNFNKFLSFCSPCTPWVV